MRFPARRRYRTAGTVIDPHRRRARQRLDGVSRLARVLLKLAHAEQLGADRWCVGGHTRTGMRADAIERPPTLHHHASSPAQGEHSPTVDKPHEHAALHRGDTFPPHPSGAGNSRIFWTERAVLLNHYEYLVGQFDGLRPVSGNARTVSRPVGARGPNRQASLVAASDLLRIAEGWLRDRRGTSTESCLGRRLSAPEAPERNSA